MLSKVLYYFFVWNTKRVVCHNVYSYFEKNVHVTIPQGNMEYDQYTVPDDFSCRIYFCCFPLALENTFPWPFVPILSNFFEEWRTQNHPQCLSGLSRELFPTTFLKIAVYSKSKNCKERQAAPLSLKPETFYISILLH